ncbi:hypothetical protein [Nonomuraea longicatena]|uniref:Peptidase M23 domain-containing protein n=1 Tax=Nonomuraea longicatena TaxID=83682 RepID=A0ABP4AQ88_9ACTN
MTAFDMELASPVPSGLSGGLGGPNQGGHQPPDWYIQFGMDLGAGEGVEVHAAFDAHVTKYSPHDPSADSGKVYGAQLFMRAPNDMMGGFYTHITNVPSEIAVGSQISRGDLLGTIMSFDGIPSHVHAALVEIIGGAPNGQYQGVDLYQTILNLADSTVTVTFAQDGSPPTVN